MIKRRSSPRLAKLHRSYTIDEVARIYGVHRNTVRHWIKRGLSTNDDRRPILILGRDLAAFLGARRARNKRTCKPGEIYCVRCREPKELAGGMVDFEPQTETLGNLVALCPTCETMIYRCTSLAKLASALGNLEVTFLPRRPRIGERAPPTVNSDLE